MKYVLLVLALLVVGCTDPDDVSVFLELKREGTCYIYCDDCLAGYLSSRIKKDTLSVPDGSTLKAKIITSTFVYHRSEVAKDGLEWDVR